MEQNPLSSVPTSTTSSTTTYSTADTLPQGSETTFTTNFRSPTFYPQEDDSLALPKERTRTREEIEDMNDFFDNLKSSAANLQTRGESAQKKRYPG